MKKEFKILAAFAVIFLSACASSSPDGSKPVTTSNLSQLTMLKEEYNAAGGVSGVGEGIATKEQMAMSQAQMYARVDIATALGVKSQQLIKAWNEEIGNKDGLVSANAHQEQVNKEIVSERINGATTVKMLTEIMPDGRYKVSVLIAMSPDMLAKFADALKNSEAVSNAIRENAQKAYKSADEEFEKYEAFKNKANQL